MHATAVTILTTVVQWRIRDFKSVGLIGEVRGAVKKNPRTTVSESLILFVGKQARFISNSFRPISGAEERRVRVAAHGSVVVASWMAACRFVFFVFLRQLTNSLSLLPFPSL